MSEYFPELTDESQRKLDRRKEVGEACIRAAGGDGAQAADAEMHAVDAISDVLTAVLGAAGYDGVQLTGSAEQAATFLRRALRSYLGDVEDYASEQEAEPEQAEPEPEQEADDFVNREALAERTDDELRVIFSSGGPAAMIDAVRELLTARTPTYTWGYHSSDEGNVHVTRTGLHGARGEDLFDVALYDPSVTDPRSGRDCQTQSLLDLRELLGLANAALLAGLGPEPVADRTEG